MHLRGGVPLQVMANQCGTRRFDDVPTTSVLDRDCRAHDLDNLYVVDGSFFTSNAAVSPALKIIANALRVGDRLIE
jgi:choline dehydrogenase-like flavoprotein